MKIDLSFETVDFQYRLPIWARKEKLFQNQMLKVSIFADNKLIDELHFSVLKNIHHYELKEWKFIIDNFFKLHEFNSKAPVWDAPYFGLISSLHPTLCSELLFIVESVLLCLIGALSDKKAKMSSLYYEEILNEEVLPACLKIKIRPDKSSLEDTVRILKTIREKSPSTQLRLDGNQSFDLHELESFMSACEVALHCQRLKNVQYIEEPFKFFYDHFSWKKNKSYALALDESLEGLCLKSPLSLPRDFHLILRPSLLGISTSLKIIKEAQKSNQSVILSSSYESKSVMRALHFIASFAPLEYHGLDTLNFLPDQYSI